MGVGVHGQRRRYVDEWGRGVRSERGEGALVRESPSEANLFCVVVFVAAGREFMHVMITGFHLRYYMKIRRDEVRALRVSRERTGCKRTKRMGGEVSLCGTI